MAEAFRFLSLDVRPVKTLYNFALFLRVDLPRMIVRAPTILETHCNAIYGVH